MERAIEDCIAEGILADFLTKHRAEAMTVSIFEYDEEKELRLYGEAEREVGYEQGLASGVSQGISQGVEQTLCRLICKKIEKNIHIEQIARELEMEIEELRPYYEKAIREVTEETNQYK